VKKSLCFIGYNISTCSHIRQQLEHYLGAYVDTSTWCLASEEPPAFFSSCDLYIASSHTMLERVRTALPEGASTLVADRTINTDNLDLLLDLAPGTRVLVVGTSAETADQAIDTIKKFGFDYLELLPFHPGEGASVPEGVRKAVTMGNAHLVPEGMEECINLGVRGIDLSTYMQVAYRLSIPVEVLNAISYDYVEALLKLSVRRQHILRLNKTLTRNMEVIVDTIDEAIVAINREGMITLINPAAELLLGAPAREAAGAPLGRYLTEIDFAAHLGRGEPIRDDIRRYKDAHVIVSGTPIVDDDGSCSGLVVMLRPTAEVEALETKVRRELKRRGNVARYTFADVIGESPLVRDGIALARRFAATDMTILLEGESGTGKELFAQAIHNASQRRNGPFVALNFAALPGELAESELFGYEHGAFTGAKSGGKPGLFETAHQGTIFLDEIGDATPDVQKKLLRVLEEREVRRVGGNTVTPIDVRVIAATNVDLPALVKDHRFRGDLFYRLCALPIVVPPLRERRDDILLLIQAFAERFSGVALRIEPPLADFLRNYEWPGNIRELQNVVKYICSVRVGDEPVTIRHLQPYLVRGGGPGAAATQPRPEPRLEPAAKGRELEALHEELEERGLVPTAAFLLAELRRSTRANRGLGRSSILRTLREKRGATSEYGLRNLLKRLEEAGCVDTGVTRQGMRITALGEDFLESLGDLAAQAC